MVFNVVFRGLRYYPSRLVKFNSPISNLVYFQRYFATKVFKLSDIGEGISEVELVKWEKNVGDEIEEMESVCTVQSDKAAVDISSRFSGTVRKLYFKVGDTVKIGDPIMDIDVEEDEPVESAKSTPAPATPKAESPSFTKKEFSPPSSASSRSTPAVKKLARELGVDLNKVTGTGPGGQVTKEDVENFGKVAGGANETVVKLSGIPLAMAKVMTESLSIPTVSIGQNVDFTDFVLKAKSLSSKVGFKLTLTPLLVKVFSLAITKYPIFNSKFGPGNQYTLFNDHNITVAIATEHGLVVPNVKNVEKKNLVEIANEINRLQKLASNKSLPLQDINNGTFTVSNLGSIGSSAVYPRLVPGQAAIVGISAAELVLKPFNGEVKERKIAQIGLTADHRHIDGATMAMFLAEVKRLIENHDVLDQYV